MLLHVNAEKTDELDLLQVGREFVTGKEGRFRVFGNFKCSVIAMTMFAIQVATYIRSVKSHRICYGCVATFMCLSSTLSFMSNEASCVDINSL